MANQRFLSVNGTTSLTGRVETASMLTTTAGLTLAVSEPRVGSRSTHQISPRRGLGSLIGQQIPTQERDPFVVFEVVVLCTLGFDGQQAVAFCGWQPQEVTASGGLFLDRLSESHALGLFSPPRPGSRNVGSSLPSTF